MLTVRSTLATTLLLTALPSVANEPAYYDSLRLVSAMREDERMVLSARADKIRRTRLSREDLQCLDSLEYPQLTDIAAWQINDAMTADEVQDALGYFQSSSGRKFVKRQLGELGEAPFTTGDQLELERFKQRPAGRKLLRDLILQDAALMTQVAQRVDRRLEDCEYYRQNDAEREIPEKICQARPVASSDNVCLATYAAEGSGRKPRRASVEVNCRHDGRVLTSRISLPNPEAQIALRWVTDRDLDILVDGKVKNAPAAAASNPKVSFMSWRKGDPPLLTCETRTRGLPTLADALPPNVTVGSWRTYGRPGLCLMTARVPKESLPGADGDVLLQFRRQKPAMAPFATTDLAFIAEIYQQREQPLLVEYGEKRLTLIAHPPQQKHMLTGMTAEILLDGLRSRPMELTVLSGGAPSYSIPMFDLDFDFAYTEFRECLATLAAT